MSYQLTCSSCHHVLRVAEGCSDPWITCPRCLARAVNPAALVKAGAPPPSPDQFTASGVAEEPTCPGCGERIQRSWRFCPLCEEPLRGALVRRRPLSVDRQARSDLGMVGAGLVLLGLLGAMGIILFMCSGGATGDKGREQAIGTLGMVFSGVLFVLVIVGMVLAVQGRNPGSGITSSITGAFAILGLVLAFGVSWLVYVFAGCSTACGSQKRPNPPPKRVSLAAPAWCVEQAHGFGDRWQGMLDPRPAGKESAVAARRAGEV
jgi:hypothetical protein